MAGILIFEHKETEGTKGEVAEPRGGCHSGCGRWVFATRASVSRNQFAVASDSQPEPVLPFRQELRGVALKRWFRGGIEANGGHPERDGLRQNSDLYSIAGLIEETKAYDGKGSDSRA
jgi:hypothetical protein